MKVIEIDRYVDAADSRDTARLPGDWVNARLLTDSSCTLPGRPLFVPEFSDEWELYLAPAVRICRLGKFIGERFAHRYYDAISVVARLRPLDARCQSACADAFDSALMLGRWVDIDASAPLPMMTVTRVSDMQTTLEPEALGIDRAVSRVSEWFTLKTGDIIIPGRTEMSWRPIINTHEIVELGPHRVLEFNIK